MPQITFVEHDGKEHALELELGLSVMEGAVKNDVPGIDANCGGACACATCQVYVDDSWLQRLPPKSPAEEQMLEYAAGATPNSRLSCQLEVTDALDGIRLTVPESQ